MEASAMALSSDRLATILEDGEFVLYRSDDRIETAAPRSVLVMMPRVEQPLRQTHGWS